MAWKYNIGKAIPNIVHATLSMKLLCRVVGRNGLLYLVITEKAKFRITCTGCLLMGLALAVPPRSPTSTILVEVFVLGIESITSSQSDSSSNSSLKVRSGSVLQSTIYQYC
eukprot:scaffold26577_cov22-Cyclotella_meneghiniana.AAC.1